MKFVITKVDGDYHEDLWESDAGTGACSARWQRQSDGEWKIVSDEITFWPNVANAEGKAKAPEYWKRLDALKTVTVSDVCSQIKTFQIFYGMGEIDGAIYDEKAQLYVNGELTCDGKPAIVAHMKA